MPAPFLGQMLLGVAQQRQSNAAQQQAFQREKEMLRYKEDLDLEYKNKFAEAQYQMQQKALQEDMGRTIAENSQIGQQLLKYAETSTDPEERENFTRLGKLHMSMSTLPSKDIVNFANTLKVQKPTISDRKAAEELRQEGLFARAWEQAVNNYEVEDLLDPEKRTEIFKLTKGMNKTYIEQFQKLIDQVTPKERQLPPDLDAAQKRYNEAQLQLVAITKSRMRPNEKETALREVQEAMNLEADTLNEYLQSKGKQPSFARFEREIKNVPREGTFGSAMDWLFGEQKQETVKKTVPGRETLVLPSVEDRMTELVASNPDASYEEIKAQLSKELQEGKIRQ